MQNRIWLPGFLQAFIAVLMYNIGRQSLALYNDHLLRTGGSIADVKAFAYPTLAVLKVLFVLILLAYPLYIAIAKRDIKRALAILGTTLLFLLIGFLSLGALLILIDSGN